MNPASFPVLESSPEPPPKSVSPPVKKRKVVEKAKRKVLARRNKRSKVLTPEPEVEGPRIEVDLPPSMSLLDDMQTSIEIARQLLSEVDTDTIKQDQCPDDGALLSNDKVVEQKDRMKELEENDLARGEKLQDIERKFEDVKMGTEGLMFELQKSMDEAREGTPAMEALATFKAQYDILKDYKEGLLDEVQVDEEIEMFEKDCPDEARRPSSIPASAPTEAVPSDVEPPVHANPSDDREARE
ncbi:hypothetical protein TIFTF001_039186 [Ficus carica]|uniref:Uncharacterized protein n=1 Tax=Ficus carica TaxID=3494 RepID=A0AA88JDW1_FICCA|nr:hypothetical protein TIFTF001_039186 [Ficus carica]